MLMVDNIVVTGSSLSVIAADSLLLLQCTHDHLANSVHQGGSLFESIENFKSGLTSVRHEKEAGRPLTSTTD